MKDANSSIIMGRKIDSPQLRVGKDLSDRPPSTLNDISMRFQPISFQKEDLIGSNYQVNLLNQTNKDIQKKQFDFNFKQPKANITIQYDTNPRGTSAANKQQRQKQPHSSKRQLSQSGPKNQIIKEQSTNQPLINLQIGNVKMTQPSKATQQLKKQLDLKFASNNHVASKSKHRKNKSEIKTTSNKALSKSSIVTKQPMKRHPRGEQVSAFQDGLMFSFDNKENQSMNMLKQRDLTPNQKANMSISSISSGSAQKVLSNSKQYFMDKSSFLRHLSPDKSDSKTKTHKIHHDEQLIKSNVSTLTNHQSKKKALRINRAQTGSNQPQKIFVKGIDKLIKDNLKKNKSKEEEEILKKYLEDYRQKQKRVELSQRNQEVRKINASKIIPGGHQHKLSAANQEFKFQNLNYKKQRSKSCMNKTDNIFVNMQKREKQLQVQILQQQVIAQEQDKKERKREKSFVLEMKELKKEIDNEIKKEILEGKLDMVSASNKRTNLTTLTVKPKKLDNPNNKSKDDILYYQTRQRKKSKQRDSKIINQNIQKFIDKKKKAQIAKKSMEQTLEQEKHLKIKANLLNLNKFVKQHLRHQSQNIFIKKLQPKTTQERQPSKKLKPHFYKFKKGDDSKILDLEGEMMFDQQHDMGPEQSFNQSPERDNEYSKMLKFLLQKAKKQKNGQKKQKKSQGSLSQEVSPNKVKQAPKTLKMKLQVPRPLKQASEQDLYHKVESSPEYQMTAIKNEVVPRIPEDQVASLVPPQSDITTLEQNPRELSDVKGHIRQKSSLSQKSPQTLEMLKKQKALKQRYGYQAQSQSDEHFFIRLHSAAIFIQQKYRQHLSKKGFYEEEYTSQMYIDSELEGEFTYQLESGYKQNQLHAISLEQSKDSTIQSKNNTGYKNQMSPLRVKNFGAREFVQDQPDRSSKFYAEDNNNQEKVIVCSVINSSRPEDNDSLQNTQYVPLRQKLHMINEAKQRQISVTNEDAKQTYLEQQDQSSSSTRKNIIPSLDLGKLQVKEEKKTTEEEESKSSARNIFERNPFQEFSSKVHSEDFNMDQYPELLKLREDAIKYKEQTEQKYINKMYKAQQFSPRTYEVKRKELESWVTKEREEVKKSRKAFEKQWQKASDMIEQTQKDQDIMKKLLMDSGRISLPSKRDTEPVALLSQRLASSRREPTLIDMIYDKPHPEPNSLEKQLLEQLEQEKKRSKELEIQKLKEEQEKKLAQQKLEEAEKKRKSEEHERLQVQKEQERLQKEKAVEELKRVEAEKKQKEEELKKQREEVEKRRREEEEAQHQKDLEAKRKQEQLEKLRKAEEDRARQVKEQRDKEEAERQKKLKEEQLKKQEEDRLRQQQREERERKNSEIQKKLDSLNQKFSSSPKKESPQKQMSLEESDDLKSEPDMGFVDTPVEHEDVFNNDKDNQLIFQILRIPSQKHLEEISSELEESKVPSDKEEPGRGLSRTRSSQDLKGDKEASSEDEKVISDPEDVEQLLRSNLNDKSIDEDQSTKSVVRPLNKNNFFTKNFDEEKAEDLFEKYKNSTTADLKQIIELDDITLVETKLEDSKVEVNKANKIYIEDKGEELTHLDDLKGKRMTQAFKDQIPVEEEEKFAPAMPVSPASMDAADLRIQTGSQSLESTLSDDKKLKQAIHDASKLEKLDEREEIVDDITDDIFKAVMAEMKLELDLLLIRDPRKLFKEDEQPPQNYFLSESGRFLIFERKGIKTDLFAIEKYVEEVLDEVLKEKNRFIVNINQPLSKKALEVLNQLQNSEIGSYEHFEVNFPNILPLDLYLKLEKRRKESRERERDLREEGKESVDKNFLAECEHIHNKVLFDCINDSLLQFKPYGKDGVPLPWSRQSRRLKPIEDFTIEEMFEIVKHDLFRWAIMQAGTLPRKEFVFGGVFDDELFAEIREKKLATLLAREMIENEPKWLNYEFEEAQVKIDIGDMILEQLVTETITILNQKLEVL